MIGPTERLARRLLAAPRQLPGEPGLAAAVDALGGELVRLRSRDGVRLTGRWLPPDPGGVTDDGDPSPGAATATGSPRDAPDGWAHDPHEAILLLHGYSGSIAPDLLEYAPFLRRTAGLLGLDFRGHGGSDDAPTTFGMHEIEDVAGALAWLGERGITRVALVGLSMGGITAIASVAVLGDGRLESADRELDAPAAPNDAPRPRIVGVVGDSVGSRLAVVVGGRIGSPFGRLIADRAFGRMARILGADPRATEPLRVVPLLEDVPLLLIHGDRDPMVPLREGRRLLAAAPKGTRQLVIEGAGHSAAHRVDSERYEREVTAFLRAALGAARS